MSNPDNGQASAAADTATTTTDTTSATTTQAATTTQQGEDPGKVKEGQQGEATDTNTDPAKAEADAKAAADAKAKEEAENRAPDKYEPFTLPDGYVLEGERLESVHAKFKELGISQAKGQQLIEFYCKADGENAGIRDQFLATERQNKIENWGKEAKEQLGTKYDESVSDARVAVAAVNRPELLAAFDAEGWGNHPELIRAFAFFGQLAKGSGLKGMGEEGVKKDRSEIPIENRFYPNMK